MTWRVLVLDFGGGVDLCELALLEPLSSFFFLFVSRFRGVTGSDAAPCPSPLSVAQKRPFAESSYVWPVTLGYHTWMAF